MLDRSRISGWKLIVAALYAVAMLTLGFAHVKAGKSAGFQASSAQFAALALPDGAISPLCGKAPADPAHRHDRKICDACQLTSAPGAISAPPAALAAPRLIVRLAPPRLIASIAGPAAIKPQSRGPPELS